MGPLHTKLAPSKLGAARAGISTKGGTAAAAEEQNGESAEGRELKQKYLPRERPTHMWRSVQKPTGKPPNASVKYEGFRVTAVNENTFYVYIISFCLQLIK